MILRNYYRFLNLVIVFCLFLVLANCSLEEGEKLSEGISSCFSVDGTWITAEITCEGVQVSDDYLSFSFLNETSMNVLKGIPQCISIYNFSIASIDKQISLTGVGNVKCTQTGASTSTCGGDYNSCDNSVSVDTISNSYSSCQINNQEMTVVKQVTDEQVAAALSPCAAGETEIRKLKPSIKFGRAKISISDDPFYNYGNVGLGSSAAKVFSVTNTGNLNILELSAITSGNFSFTGGSYPGSSGTCTDELSIGSTCQIDVTYTPLTSGPAIGALSVSFSSMVNGQTVSRTLVGNGINDPVLTISDANPYDFGSTTVGLKIQKAFTISNIGDGDASNLSISGLAAPFNYRGGTYPGSGGDCGTILTSGNSCILVLEFAPTLTGNFNLTYALNYDNAVATKSVTKDLSGQAVAPALLIISDANPYDFGSVSLGSNIDKVFTITNTGDTKATGLSPSGPNNPFSYTGGSYPGTGETCGTELDVGLSCTVKIRVTGSFLGNRTGTATINYNDGVSAQSVDKDLRANGTL